MNQSFLCSLAEDRNAAPLLPLPAGYYIPSPGNRENNMPASMQHSYVGLKYTAHHDTISDFYLHSKNQWTRMLRNCTKLKLKHIPLRYTSLTASFSTTTWISWYQKGKTTLDLNKARDDGVVRSSSISWTICKQSAPRTRQISTPTPHHSIFTGRALFLMPNQQCQSIEGQSAEEQSKLKHTK